MKGVVIHALLALVGLSFAYSTWTREEEVEELAPGTATIVECAPGQMTRIALETPTNLFTIAPQKRGEETLYWVLDETIPPKPKEPTAEQKAAAAAKRADGGLPDAGAAQADAGVAKDAATPEPAKPVPAPKVQRFLAKAAYLEFLAKVAPLRADRALGVIEEARFKDFGFDEVGTYLRVECGGKTTELEIGGRTYGTAKRYARNPASGEAYLLDKAIVQDLRSSRYKFMQTELHTFGLHDVGEVTITAEGATRTLLHRNRQFDKDAHWVDSAAPDQRNELFSNWFTRVSKLKVREYLPDGAGPGSELDADKGKPGTAYTAVKIVYLVDGKNLGQLELVAVPQGDQTHYYAKTEATHNWVTIYDSAAKQVVDDVLEVVGGDAPSPLASEAPQPANAQ